MKKILLFKLVVIVFLCIQCKKERDAIFTQIHFKAVDWLTGDSIPKLKLTITNQTNYSNQHQISTNEFGRFDTLLNDYNEDNYIVEMAEFENYYLLTSNKIFAGGKSNDKALEFIPLGNLDYNFNCNGPGDLKNFKLEYLNLEGYPNEIISTNHTLYNYVSYPTCYFTYNKEKMAAGKWQISYDLKEYPALAWYNVKDTITIYPDSTSYLSIFY